MSDEMKNEMSPKFALQQTGAMKSIFEGSPDSAQLYKKAVDDEDQEQGAQDEIQSACTALTWFSHGCAYANGWWHDLATGAPKDRNNGELFMLMVSEVAEAMEGDRKNKMDEHLPHRRNVEVELADAVIRIFDFAGARGLDIGGALFEKLRYNNSRADHKPENRVKEDGKKY